MRKPAVALISITMILLIALTACGSKSTQDTVSEAFDIDVSSGSEVSHYDTHSGNGDGTSCIVLSFGDDSVLEEIESNTEWKAFPLDETTQTIVHLKKGSPALPGEALTLRAASDIIWKTHGAGRADVPSRRNHGTSLSFESDALFRRRLARSS